MSYENQTYDELHEGQTAHLRRICMEDDFYVFANASGNHNPLHLADIDGDGDGVPEMQAPGLWVGSLVSAVIGNILPGAGTNYISQSFEFMDHAYAGDELIAQVEVEEKLGGRMLRLGTTVVRAADKAVLVKGVAVVEAPLRKLVFEDLHVPGLVVQRHRHFKSILAQAEQLPPLPVAVVAPEERNSLGGAMLARAHGIIEPILVGDRRKIESAATEIGADLDGVEIIQEDAHPDCATAAVRLIREGHASALMKGHLHTDELLRAALHKTDGLRAGRRFTHVFIMDVPGLSHPLLVSDAAINIEPDLASKVDIVQNAIDVAISIGVAEPKVGVLSAVETVNPNIASSIDAALLSKMCERGQITGGLVDGPLAMDNAVDIGAARTKGLTSPVAGHADILVVPNLDAGNMLVKQLTYIAHAEAAGLVLGARAPIILTSRADGDEARLASCAIAALHHRRINGAGQ